MKARTVAQTIAAEAAQGTPEERFQDMLSIASVVVNRANQLKVSPEQVVSVKSQFNAYDSPMPEGVSNYVDMAERALRQVQEEGPVHNATFYSTPSAVGNLPKGLKAIAETTGHRYFSDPQSRAIQTASGFRRPSAAVSAVSAPVPTPAPRTETAQAPRGLGLLGVSPTAARNAGLLGEDNPSTAARKPTGNLAALGYTNQTATRNRPVTESLSDSIQRGVTAVYGPGYSADVYSGGQPAKGTPGRRVGTTRHDNGRAADVHVTDPEGKRVTGTELAKLGQHWSANKIGGVGLQMANGGIHLDTYTDRAPSWNYAKQGGIYTKEQAALMAKGLAGVPPSYAVPEALDPASVRYNPSIQRQLATMTPTPARVTTQPTALRPVAEAARPAAVQRSLVAANAPVSGLLSTAANARAPTVTVSPQARPATVAPTTRVATAPNTATRITGLDVTPGFATKGPRVTGPQPAGVLSDAAAANLASRLDRSVPAVASVVNGGLLAANALSKPASAPKPGALAAIGSLLGPNAAQAATMPNAPLMSRTPSVAPSIAPARVQSNFTTVSNVPNNATALAPVQTTARIVGKEIARAPMITSYGPQLPTARAPQPPSLPSLPAPQSIPARQVAAVTPVNPSRFGPAVAPVTRTLAPEVANRVMSPNMAARVTAQPAAQRAVVSAPSFSTAGLPGIPGVPEQSTIGRLGSLASMNRGKIAGGLLGSVIAGPIGGLLGGFIGSSMVEGRPSTQAKAALRSGWDGFSGMSPAAANAAVNASSPGLLGSIGQSIGGLFGGGFGGSSASAGPSVSRSSTSSASPSSGIGGNGSNFGNSSFGGGRNATGSNNNTSSSKSSGSSKSGGGKKK